MVSKLEGEEVVLRIDQPKQYILCVRLYHKYYTCIPDTPNLSNISNSDYNFADLQMFVFQIYGLFYANWMASNFH